MNGRSRSGWRFMQLYHAVVHCTRDRGSGGGQPSPSYPPLLRGAGPQGEHGGGWRRWHTRGCHCLWLPSLFRGGAGGEGCRAFRPPAAVRRPFMAARVLRIFYNHINRALWAWGHQTRLRGLPESAPAWMRFLGGSDFPLPVEEEAAHEHHKDRSADSDDNFSEANQPTATDRARTGWIPDCAPAPDAPESHRAPDGARDKPGSC
jgi:hypothetical protein